MLSEGRFAELTAIAQSGAYGTWHDITRELWEEVKRLRAPLTGEDARLVEDVRDRLEEREVGARCSDPPCLDDMMIGALLDLLSRYEHATYDRELDAGAFVAMERTRIVAWLRERAANYRSVGTPHRMDWATVLEAAADTIEVQGVADPAPPAVVRAELARLRAKVWEVLATNIPANIAAMLRKALEGEKTP